MAEVIEKKERSVLLVGGPDAGKSNYLGRLWMALDRSSGLLIKNGLPTQSEYVRSLAESLLQGNFARHTSQNTFQENIIPVQWKDGEGTQYGNLVVPDCAGEQWEKIHQSREWTTEWEEVVRTMTGCLVFFRSTSSHHVPALDWATAGQLMGCLAHSQTSAAPSEPKLPTQVVLVDWLQCLYSAFKEFRGPSEPLRLSIIVSAWDKVATDKKRLGPDSFLDESLPLLHDFLRTNLNFKTRIFGVSIVGGDLTDAQPGFKDKYLNGQPYRSGYVVHTQNGKVITETDLTIPLGWAFGCSNDPTRME